MTKTNEMPDLIRRSYRFHGCPRGAISIIGSVYFDLEFLAFLIDLYVFDNIIHIHECIHF